MSVPEPDSKEILLWLFKLLELGFLGYVCVILIVSIGIIFTVTNKYQYFNFWDFSGKKSENRDINRLFLLNQMRDKTQTTRNNLAHNLDKIAHTVGFYRKFLFQFLDIMDRIWGKPLVTSELTLKFSDYLTVHSLDRCLSFAILYPIVISIFIWLFTTQSLTIAGITFIEEPLTFIQIIFGIILLMIGIWSYYKQINQYIETQSIKKSLLYFLISSIIFSIIYIISFLAYFCFCIIIYVSGNVMLNNRVMPSSITDIIYNKNIGIMRRVGNILSFIWANFYVFIINDITFSSFCTILYASNIENINNYITIYSRYFIEYTSGFFNFISESILNYFVTYFIILISYSFPQISGIIKYIAPFFSFIFLVGTLLILLLSVLTIILCIPVVISITINHYIIKNNHKIYNLYLLCILTFSGVVVYTISSEKGNYVFYVLFVLLPIINAYFDWISISATRYFLQKSLTNKEKAFENTFYDIGIAILCAVGVTSSTIGALFLYNHITGQEIFDIMSHIKALSSLTLDNFAEKFKSHGWMILCFYATFLPTIIHLGFMLTSFIGTTKLTVDFKDLAEKVRQGYFKKTKLDPDGKNDPCEYVDDFTIYFNMNTPEPEIQLKKIINILWLHWVIVICIVILSFYGIFLYIVPYLFKFFI